SGGPEVFRRLLRSTPDVVEAALRDLVAEGILKETVLRVGRIYAYPASTKSSHVYLAEQLAKASTAEPRAATRPAGARPHAAPAAGSHPSAPVAATPTAAPTGPIRAVKKS